MAVPKRANDNGADGGATYAKDWLERLAAPVRIDSQSPVAMRFIFALRMIACHEVVGKDPIPCLAVKLGSLASAGQAMELAELCSRFWPEPINLARPCCLFLSHDEQTMATMVDAAAGRDHAGFCHQLDGLVRHERREALWDSAVALVAVDHV